MPGIILWRDGIIGGRKVRFCELTIENASVSSPGLPVSYRGLLVPRPRNIHRAHHKGEWKTNPDHLPKNYKDFSEWNSTYFIRKASTIGPHTTELIKRILKSRKLEVQTYRLCIGVLGFTKKYSHTSLEECCRRALAAERATYTYIKNTIGAVAEELGSGGYNTDKNKKRNEGAYIMDSSYSDMNKLLDRSRALADQSGKEALR